jgi:hypothetical protein
MTDNTLNLRSVDVCHEGKRKSRHLITKAGIQLMAALCLLGSMSVFYFFFLNDEPVLGYDSLTYIVLSKAIISGNGYHDIHLVGSTAHVKFPPLFPLLLSPLVYFYGDSFIVFKSMVIIFSILSIFAVYRLFLKTDRGNALIVMLLIAISPHYFSYAHSIYSEIPFLFFSVSTLIFAIKYNDCEAWNHPYGFLTVIFLLFAYFSRSIGISLFPAILLSIMMNNIKGSSISKIIFITGFFLIPICGWEIRNQLFKSLNQDTIPYIDWLFKDPYSLGATIGICQAIEGIMKNIYAYLFYSFPELLTGYTYTTRSYSAFLLSCFIVVGLTAAILKKKSLCEWYMIFYMFILFLWPWSKISGTRFIIPIIPFVFYYFILGFKTTATAFNGKILRKILVSSAVVLLITSNLSSTVGMISRGLSQERNDQAVYQFIEMSKWLESNTDKREVLLSFHPAAFYLYANRVSLDIPYIKNSMELSEYINTKKPVYFIIDSMFAPEGIRNKVPSLWDWLEANNEKLKIIYEKNGNMILKFREASSGKNVR